MKMLGIIVGRAWQRNLESVIDRLVELLLASDVPFRRLD
jgi:hypothetical protein